MSAPNSLCTSFLSRRNDSNRRGCPHTDTSYVRAHTEQSQWCDEVTTVRITHFSTKEKSSFTSFHCGPFRSDLCLFRSRPQSSLKKQKNNIQNNNNNIIKKKKKNLVFELVEWYIILSAFFLCVCVCSFQTFPFLKNKQTNILKKKKKQPTNQQKFQQFCSYGHFCVL